MIAVVDVIVVAVVVVVIVLIFTQRNQHEYTPCRSYFVILEPKTKTVPGTYEVTVGVGQRQPK